MPAVSLTALPTIPYVYSGTTPATPDTCQLVTVPSIPGVTILLHNRDKANHPLRLSWDTTLTQDGAAPAMWFSIDDTIAIKCDSAAHSGFQPAVTLALFSDAASVNYELMFIPT